MNSGVLNGGEIQRAVIIDVNPPSLNRVDTQNLEMFKLFHLIIRRSQKMASLSKSQ